MWLVYNEGADENGVYHGSLERSLHNAVPIEAFEATRGKVNRFFYWWGAPLWERVITEKRASDVFAWNQLTDHGRYVCGLCFEICGGWDPMHHEHHGHLWNLKGLAKVYHADAFWTSTEPARKSKGLAVNMRDFLIVEAILNRGKSQVIADIYGISDSTVSKRLHSFETWLGIRVVRFIDRTQGHQPTAFGSAAKKHITDICNIWRQLLAVRQNNWRDDEENEKRS